MEPLNQSIRNEPVRPQVSGGAPKASRPDVLTWVILGGFAWLSLFAIAFMWKGYVHEKHQRAVTHLFAAEDYGPALEHINALLRTSPKNAQLLAQLGQSYLALNRPDEAMDAFNRSLKINPEQNLDEKLGIAYAEAGKQDEALEYFKKVLDKDLYNPAANFYLGVYLLKEGQYAQAGRSFYAAASDPQWDKRADPYRKQLEQAVWGTGAQPASGSDAPSTPTLNQ